MSRVELVYFRGSEDERKTLEREGRWYDGEIAECKGGGSSVNNVDYEYNDRMATIAEEQQAWAKDYYKMWETHFKPYETAQAQTNLQNLPLENSVYRGQLEAARDLLPLESGLYKQQLKAEAELLPQQTEATKNFLSASAQGVDVAERMGLAKADVSSAWKNVSDATARSNARMGVTHSTHYRESPAIHATGRIKYGTAHAEWGAEAAGGRFWPEWGFRWTELPRRFATTTAAGGSHRPDKAG